MAWIRFSQNPISAIALTAVITSLTSLVSCSVTRDAVDVEAERRALMSVDLEFARMTAEKGADGWTSFFAEDGIMMPAGTPDIVGPQAIKATMSRSFSRPEYKLSWKPRAAHVAASGDLGYTIGTYTSSYRNPEGQLVSSSGRYVTIWKKTRETGWKVALDIGNETPP